MKRRRLVVNGVIVLALAGVGAATYASLAGARSTPLTAGQVVTVTRGTVVATVTASGNAKARSTVAQNLSGASGTVTTIYVHTGQHVKKGQRLLKVDDSDARDAVDNAESDLRSAQAQLQTATQGRTVAEQQQDQASIASAETALKNAKTSLHAAEDTQDLDSKQQDQLVHEAKQALDAAKDAPSSSGTPSTGGTGTSSASTEQQAENAYLQAKQQRDSTELKDKQSVASARGQVASAQRTLDSQRATVAVNDQPADADTVASAQTAVDKDEVALKQARATAAHATLRASVAGTVGTISAVKGESSSGAGSSGSSSSSSTSGSGSGGSSSSGGSSGSGSSSSSTSSGSGSGLVEIVDTKHLQVTADVAEADIVKVHDGQPATAVFAASNKVVQGEVTSIDTTSTVTNNVVEYGVTITLDASTSSVRVGQTATITITTGTSKDALSVPTSALTKTGDRYTVLRRANDADSTVEVQTGLVGTTNTEITSGLNEGDSVVIALSTASTTSGNGGPPRGGG